MTEKRFYVAESKLIDGYCVFDREKKYAFHPRPRKADCLNDTHTLNELHEENKDLKEEIVKFKEWEKHIEDVKREDLDRVFKMSIYEIAEAFEYYRKRISEVKYD